MLSFRLKNRIKAFVLALAVSGFAVSAVANQLQEGAAALSSENLSCDEYLTARQPSQSYFVAREPLAVVVVEPSRIHLLAFENGNQLIGEDLSFSDLSDAVQQLDGTLLKFGNISRHNTFFYSTADLRETPLGSNVMSEFRNELQVDVHPISQSRQYTLEQEPNGLSFALLKLSAEISGKMSEYAATLEQVYQQNLLAAVKQMEVVFGPNFGQFEFRSKKASSIRAKLIRRAVNDNLDIPDATTAQKSIGDGIGLRLVLKRPNKKSMDQILSRLISYVNVGDIQITEIHNYFADKSASYLTRRQLKTLRKAAQRTNRDVEFEQSTQPSGYTSLNLKLNLRLRLPSGQLSIIPIELQIRGEKIDELAKIEHIYYDFRSRKSIDTTNNQAVAKIIAELEKLNAKQRENLRRYISEWYVYARELESYDDRKNSARPGKPELPLDLPAALSIENAANAQGFKF